MSELGLVIPSSADRPPLPHGQEAVVLGNASREYSLQVGVRDERAVAAFTQGQCHAMAFALHECTGFPVVMLLDELCDQVQDCVSMPQHDGDGVSYCGCQIAHFAVADPSGLLLDIRGAGHTRQVITGWELEHGMRSLWVWPASQEIIDWVSTSDAWRRPETALASSFVAAILADYADVLGRE